MLASADESFWFQTFEAQSANLPSGTHMCQIYTTRAEQLRASVPFFRTGIYNRQQCLYLASPVSARILLRSLRAAGVPTRDLLDRRELRPITTREMFPNDGRFSAETLVAYLRRQADQAEADNFSALRVTGEMDWVLQPDIDTEQFLRFEGPGLHELATDARIRFLCQFDRRRFRPDIIQGVLQTHPQAVVGVHVLDNPYYVPPELVLDSGPANERRRVDWMVSQLEDRTRRDVALADLQRTALAGTPPDALMRAAVHFVAVELKADLAEIVELVPHGDHSRLIESVGWKRPPSVGTSIWGDAADNLLSSAVQSGQPVVITHWRDETRVKQPAALAAESIESTVRMPINPSATCRHTAAWIFTSENHGPSQTAKSRSWKRSAPRSRSPSSARGQSKSSTRSLTMHPM